MKDCKVTIISVLASDQKALVDVQKKLNQWMTTGLLRKYTTDATATHIVYNICTRKKALE